MNKTLRVGFIGAGNMARALAGGLIAAGLPKGQIFATDAKAQAIEALCKSHGVVPMSPSGAALDVVIIAVKPNDVQTAIGDARALISPRALVISIAAGIPTAALSAWLPAAVAIVRAMPNTPALIGAGISGAFASSTVSASQRQDADDVLSAAGEVIWVDDERQLDAVTAVSGSGPAYVFYLIEALEAAALAQGLDASTSRRLALATFAGASRLASGAQEAPSRLREQVTSKGGTTQAALDSLGADDVAGALKRAVAKARARAEELGRAYFPS